jgi:hypothetical protein
MAGLLDMRGKAQSSGKISEVHFAEGEMNLALLVYVSEPVKDFMIERKQTN